MIYDKYNVCTTLLFSHDLISTSGVDFEQHLCACTDVYCYRLLGAYLHTQISYHDTFTGGIPDM